MKIDFARLNHILIPKTKDGRDRFRASLLGRLLTPIGRLYSALTEEGRTLFLVTAIVGAISVDVNGASAYWFFAILSGLLFGSLVAARGLSIQGTTLTIDVPRRVTLGEEVVFSVLCRPGKRSGPLRIRGPFLPWDGTWLGDLPGEIREGSVTMRAKFVARGLHHLDPFTAAAVTPLGLANGPRVSSDAVKVWVVPKPAKIARLPVATATRHQPGGVALASKSGESMDLHGVRPYRPGDPVRDLHARTWARTGQPAVREYQQEYFQRVGVVLDTDTDDPDRLEAAIRIAAGVIAKLSRGEALVDMLVVGDKVHELTVGRSLGTLDQALELLSTVERGPKLDSAALVGRLTPHLVQLSSMIVIALRGDEERKALEKRIRDRGVACTAIVVDDDAVRAVEREETLSW